ncbi:MAG: thioredoxin-like domain-containing protein [Planctomycetaceae bacterium]
MTSRLVRSLGGCATVCLSLVWATGLPAQQVGVEQILRYHPEQPDVDYESPKPDEVAQCKVEVERGGKGSGWIVYGPNGQILRRFVDTDGDNVVDHWRYYQHGLEVYRDIDTNANNKVDQSRWLNLGGTRWGVDSNEDGKIDRWLRLSAEEASREAIAAMANRDDRALSILMLDAQDARALGLEASVADEILKATNSAAGEMRKILAQTKSIGPGSKWQRFDSSMLMPNVVPQESGKAERDLVVYENVMAMVDTNGQNGFVQIGELIQVGDVWKLTGVPRPLEGENMQVVAGGLLMQPSVASVSEGTVQLSPEVQKLIEQLQKLDEGAPGPNSKKEDAVRYNVARARLLAQLANIADGADERDLWQRQRIDGITAAAQLDAYPNGLDELAAIEQQLQAKAPKSPLLPYVIFHRLGAEYNLKLQAADNEGREKLQAEWITSLEKFVTDYPKSDDAADALLQLGVNQEFAAQPDAAIKWYQRLVAELPDTPAAGRARGSLRRLGLVGNPLVLSGQALGGGMIDTKAYRGKVLAVLFWATWCKPCTEELPQLLELYRQNRADGLEIVGVNLDSPGANVQKYIQDFKVPWQHIAEEGGLESRPAEEFGIITLPTMFLVDRQGRVVSSNASLDELKKQLPVLLKP